MRIGNVVTWEREVHPAWQKSSGNDPTAHSDIWGRLPPGVCWLEATIEESDIDSMFVIGSGDWIQSFETYRLGGIALQDFSHVKAGCHHRPKIIGFEQSIGAGRQLGPLIAVASSGIGPFVFLDGNHRAVAHLRTGQLVGQFVYLGLHHHISSEFSWFVRAIRGQ
jgi:hypothetical protein